MPRFKDHPLPAITVFLVLCAAGIWSMAQFFGNISSPYNFLYGMVFGVAIFLLSIMMRWAERDIREERERRRLA